MPSELTLARALSAGLAALVAGCAATVVSAPTAPAPPRPAAPEPMRAMALPAAAAAAAAPAPAPPAAPRNEVHPLETAVAYADRLRSLPPSELGTEIQRLGETSYAPLRATQLAMALVQSRGTANLARAQALLQRVQADAASEAQALHPYTRVLAGQIADQRRAEEQAERQAQQLREAQRRIEQLNDRLEAVRAIERSLPGPAKRESGR